MCVGTRTRSRTPIPLMGRAMCLDAIDWHPAGISRWAIQIALHDFLTLAFNSNYPVVDCVQAGSFCPFCQNRTQDRGVICLLRCVLCGGRRRTCPSFVANLSALPWWISEKKATFTRHKNDRQVEGHLGSIHPIPSPSSHPWQIQHNSLAHSMYN